MKKFLKGFMILSIFGVVGFGSKVSAHELDTVYDDGTIEEYVVSESLELNSILESQFVEGELIQDESFSPVFPDDLEYISDGNTARTIIGSDNRRIVTNTSTYPFSTAAHLVMTFPNGKSYIGSGHLISNDTVLTAGHCIYSKADGGWATSVAVYPGYNGKTAPFGVAYASKLMSISGWTSNNSSEHDIGAIKLNKSIGNNTGYMGLTTNTNSGITLTGFHGDLNGKMGTESGSISSLTPNNVFYKLDSTGGASGSGVYNNSNQILAVHAYGRTSDNFGTRINNEKFNIVNKWAFNGGDVFYTTRIKNSGWTSESKNGTTSGTTGKNTPLEGLCVALKNGDINGGVTYRTHVSNEGWLPWKSNGNVSGGAGKRMEALEVKLTGEIAKYYSIEYRSHVQDIGWTSWVKDGTTSGTTGKNKQVEAVQIRLIQK